MQSVKFSSSGNKRIISSIDSNFISINDYILFTYRIVQIEHDIETQKKKKTKLAPDVMIDH